MAGQKMPTYAIKVEEISFDGTGISYVDIFDVLIGWHNAKSGSRPTIVNISLGWNFAIDTTTSVSYLTDPSLTRLTDAVATGGSYRGTTHNDVNGIKFRENYGFQGWWNGVKKNGYMLAPLTILGLEANIKTCIDAGIHVCGRK